MRLTDAEKAMLDGADGPAKAAGDGPARPLWRGARRGTARRGQQCRRHLELVDALGAAPTWIAEKSFDAIFSRVQPRLRRRRRDPAGGGLHLPAHPRHRHAQRQASRASPNAQAEQQKASEKYFGARGVQMLITCTPYQVGNVPVKGEHCAWMESSAVVYCNAVLGARTNTEGRESDGGGVDHRADPVLGPAPPGEPPWHASGRGRGRRRQHAWTGACSATALGRDRGRDIPVLDGTTAQPQPMKLKHFGAAAASSGGVEMYHIPGVTPEATVAEAFGGGHRRRRSVYGADERREAYERLNAPAASRDVDFVMLGCPHNSLEQMWIAARAARPASASAKTSRSGSSRRAR